MKKLPKTRVYLVLGGQALPSVLALLKEHDDDCHGHEAVDTVFDELRDHDASSFRSDWKVRGYHRALHQYRLQAQAALTRYVFDYNAASTAAQVASGLSSGTMIVT